MEQLLFEFREGRCFPRAYWPSRASKVFRIEIRLISYNYCTISLDIKVRKPVSFSHNYAIANFNAKHFS